VKISTKLLSCFVLLALFAAAPVATATQVQVSIENLASAGGVALSPFTLIAHNGSFDAFNNGSSAVGTGIEDVAELGAGANLISEGTAAQASAVTATLIATMNAFGPGIFNPGGSGSTVLSLDSAANRYLTYGAMVVPSNDAFLGNDNPTAVELFDVGGTFVASNFTLFGSNIWDAGTEVNQLFGAAYAVGQNAGDGADENGVVHIDLTQFNPFLNQDVPPGGIFTDLPAGLTPIASFSFQVVPEPSTITLFGLGLLAMTRITRRGRRRRSYATPGDL
jgi:hypothetical protein